MSDIVRARKPVSTRSHSHATRGCRCQGGIGLPFDLSYDNLLINTSKTIKTVKSSGRDVLIVLTELLDLLSGPG